METLIKNIKVYDGTGKDAYVSSVFIKDGKIAKIGETDCKNVIDGTGLCLAPGFIDSHSHAETQMFIDPDRKEKLMMGVTLEVAGQCGSGKSPKLRSMPEKADLYFRRTGFHDDDFETFRENTEAIRNLKLGAHQTLFMGYNLVRGSVIGMENRKATRSELDRMKGLVAEAMQNGALGFTTGLVYPPCLYSDTEELIEVCKVVAKYGGMYTTHIRGEADTVLDALSEAITIAKTAGVPLNVSHLKAMYPQNYDKIDKMLEMIDKENANGMDITFDVYPYAASSATIMSTLPPSYNSNGIDWTVEHLTGKENIAKLERIINEGLEKWENPVKNIGTENMLIVEAQDTPECIGKTIKEISEMKGISPVEAYAYVIAANRGRVKDVRFCMSEENLKKLYAHPRSMVGTDGIYTSRSTLSHPRHFGTFPRYLGRFIREMKVLPMQEGIRRITGMPAERFGLKTKGKIKEGYDADLVIFDERTIIDNATFIEPKKTCTGIKKVFVMGEVAVDDGKYTGLRNGKYYSK